MRFIYSLFFYFALPLVMARMAWRSLRLPAYGHRWNERLAWYFKANAGEGNVLLWFHAVSVGEAESAFPLIRAIQAEYSRVRILVTTTTPTGSARVVDTLGNSVLHVYLPYDLPDCVGRFLTHFKPALGVVMETEVWPNLYQACLSREIPLALVNARLTERSARAYGWVGGLIRHCLQALCLLAAQTPADARRYLGLGMDPQKTVVTGNIKFDAELSPGRLAAARAARETLFADRPVWIAGSTHQGEEGMILAAHRALLPQHPDLVLVLAPRHPERMHTVADLIHFQGLSMNRRSEMTDQKIDSQVYLVDTLGELRFLYAMADVAFVGGSLIPVGGHNMLEPAAIGLPIVFGPYVDNFREIAERIQACGAGVMVGDVAHLAAQVDRLIRDPLLRTQWGIQAQAFVNANQGAARRVLDQLSPLIEAGIIKTGRCT
ncbi:3-deoxy-D-manno-octulosonic acid transferase [Candidatus Woesearchaeota archaeon]|nr:3-deoxy-D-manno-octulosonic acid transferase [Candidatus Woesearchaeota archaeon]